MTQPLEREAIMPRLNGIKRNIAKLRKLGELPLEDFQSGDAFDLAQHHLRLALEGVFHIGAHVLSRLPGSRAVEYKEIAERLGDAGIVEKSFATEKLVPMAKLRNLLVHQYADIDPAQIYNIVQNHLGDIETFLSKIKELLEKPEKFDLEVK